MYYNLVVEPKFWHKWWVGIKIKTWARWIILYVLLQRNIDEDSSDDCDFILDNGESTMAQVTAVAAQPQNNDISIAAPSV